MAKVNLSSPWDIYYKQVKELFKFDPMVHLIYDEEEQILKFYVDDDMKAAALEAFLPKQKTFGKVKMKLVVIPANGTEAGEGEGDQTSLKELMKAFFSGNGAVSYFYESSGIYVFNALYVVFQHEIVQYFSDDLSDINGLTSTLYQDLARELLEVPAGVFFCTDVAKDSVRVAENEQKKSFGAPLGEWP